VRGLVRSQAVSVLTWPPVALALYAGVIVGTHLTSLMNLVLEHRLVHDAEHLAYLFVGYVFFLPVLGSEPIRWRLSHPARLAVLALAMPVDTFTGVVLGMTSSEPFPAYTARHRAWGPSPVADLHLGGAIMWVGGDGLMLAMIVVLALAMARRGENRDGAGRWLEAARSATLAQHAAAVGITRPETDQRPTIDDEQHHTAYNAYRAALANYSATPTTRAPTGSPQYSEPTETA
jgi:putative copper resistance protein D